MLLSDDPARAFVPYPGVPVPNAPEGPLAGLINALGTAFGLMLGMTGSCALLLLISITSSVSAVIT